jgi:drug/metabolite transporter (DMT)-like permease
MKFKTGGSHLTGIGAALGSAFFLGLAPIFGKQAMLIGFNPLAVVALRTILAAALLLILVVVFRRRYLYIYPAGLIGCGLAGVLNGIGSILYYLSLGRLSVSMGQLLYSLYPVFLIIWFIVDRQTPSRLTLLRMTLSIIGVVLLTSFSSNRIDWLGVGLMITASFMYAIHLPINQRILLDIPAPTVTLYTLLSMSAIVIPVYLILDHSLPAQSTSWWPIACLTFVTFASRLTLFLGIKKIGGLQTGLLGLSEILVSLFVGGLMLHETLVPLQWLGAGFLCASLLLVGLDRVKPEMRRPIGGLLGWLQPPESPQLTWGSHD